MQKNPTDLLNLRNLIKRDPQGYVDEFQQQWRHYQSMHSMMQLKEHHNPHLIKEFATLVTFLSHVAPCYPTVSAHFPSELVALIAEHAHTIPPYLRLNLLQALILLQNRGMISRFAVLPLFFQLFCLHDKPLRKLLFSHIVQDIKRVNQNKKNVKLNNALQNFLLSMLQTEKKRSHGQGRALTAAGSMSAVSSSSSSSSSSSLSSNSIASTSSSSGITTASIASSSSSSTGTLVGPQTQAADEKEMAAKKSLDVMIDLWRRKVWTDDKTVHIISECCFSPYTKIMVSALRFFLGLTFYDDEEDSDDDDDDAGTGLKSKKQLRMEVRQKSASLKGMIKKTKKREREIKRATKKLHREEREEAEQNGTAGANGKQGSGGSSHSSVASHLTVPALQLLRDPHTFAERLFSRLRSSTDPFVVRMLMMNVISRCVGAHQLLLLNLYPYLQKYLQPHQRHVTAILTFVAQASHPLVPPDHIRPLLTHLATQFVSDRSSVEVMQVGINAIREICARCPLAMTRSLLLDLAGYKKHNNKGVMMASRSLIALYRDVFPHLLHRRERGKAASTAGSSGGAGASATREMKEIEDDEYASFEANSDVLGAELLAAYEREQKAKAEARARGEYVVDSDDEDGDGDGQEEEEEIDEAAWEKLMQDGSDDDEDDEEDGDDGGEEEEDDAGGEEEDDATAAVDEASSTKKGTRTPAEKAEIRRQRRLRRAASTEEEEEDESVSLRGIGRKLTLSEVDDYLKELQSDSDDDAGEEDGEEIDDGDVEMEESGKEEDVEEDDEDDEEEDDENEANDDNEMKVEPQTTKKKSASASAKSSSTTTTSSSSSSSSSADALATTAASAAPPALPYAATKIFTAEDFELLRQLRLKQVMETTGSRRAIAQNKKRSAAAAGLDDDADEAAKQRSAEILALREGTAGLVGKEVDITEIESLQKKRRRTREERLETIKANRGEGGNNTSSSKRKSGGTSNVEKLKTKAFMMVRAKTLKKQRVDKFAARQQKQQQHIKNLKNMSSHLRKKVVRKR